MYKNAMTEHNNKGHRMVVFKLAIVLKALAKINIIKKSVMLGYYVITFSKKGCCSININ